MYEVQAVYKERTALPEGTLGDLLRYWQRGLLSDHEMVTCWHKRHLTDEQLLQQLIDINVIPPHEEWWNGA